MDNENLERPNYYAVITADVRYAKNLSASAKLLYGEITALCNKTGTCWASNKYFSELYGVQPTRISEWVRQLAAAGFVTAKVIKSSTGSKRYIRLTNPLLENQKPYSGKAEDINTTTNNNHIVELEKELLQIANQVTKRNFRVLPRGTKKLLDTFSLVEIEAALRAEAADPWHRDRLKELSLDYMIRPSTIDKFMATARPARKSTRTKEEWDAIEAKELADFRVANGGKA